MAETNSSGVAGNVIVGIFASLATIAVAIATGWFGFASKDEELKVHLVEIAIGILRADPKEDVAGARSWALDIIELNSGVKFNEEDRKALLHKPLIDKSSTFLSLTKDPLIEGYGKTVMDELIKKGYIAPQTPP
jgi:hypothetical protein